MPIIEKQVKSILKKHKFIDSWFLAGYSMNLYRGCGHNCAYCDGRAENYYVEGDFGHDICVKENALDILNKELDPSRKRKKMQKGFILLGGGVSDAYQPAELKYRLSRGALDLCFQYDHPVFILSKSILIEEDMERIVSINNRSKALVCISLSSVNTELSRIMEPGVPPPDRRLDMLKKFKERGVHTGVFLMPVIPFMSDNTLMLQNSLKHIKDSGVDFISFGAMTLKPGRQSAYYLDKVKKYYPQLMDKYLKVYKGDKWGNAIPDYYENLYKRFEKVMTEFNIPLRMPEYIYRDIVSKKDKLRIMMEHILYREKDENLRPAINTFIRGLKKSTQSEISKAEIDKMRIHPLVKDTALEIINDKPCQLYNKYFY